MAYFRIFFTDDMGSDETLVEAEDICAAEGIVAELGHIDLIDEVTPDFIFYGGTYI